MEEVNSCSHFEEVNPLPDLGGHILLSGESLCQVVVSDGTTQNGICKDSTNLPSMDLYTSLLNDNGNVEQYSQINTADSELSYTPPIMEKNDSTSRKDVSLSEISNTVAEEEFLYQLNLSKCDKYPSAVLSSKPPNTRNIAKLKCAKLNGSKLNTKSTEKKIKRRGLSFKEKISRLKSANQKQQTIFDTSKRKSQSVTSKSVLTAKQRLNKTKPKIVENVEEVSGICSVCRWAYSTKEEKKQHMEDPKHIVMIEAKRGTNFQALREEANVFKDVTYPAKCSICNETLLKQRDFLAHHRRHAWVQPYHCVRCSAAFYRRCDLLYHLRNHLGINKTFSCKECSSTFSKESFLTSHMIAKHGHPDTRPRNYKCTECSMSFFAKHAVNRHMRTHTGYVSVSCTYCGKGFSNNFVLQAHLRTHTGETPFQCDKCSYQSKTKQLLLRHQRSHNGDKPFKCKLCSYASASGSGLKRHMLKHTGSKPFKCPYCAYRSTNIENLRKHIKGTRKHVGLKIYPCQHCSFACDGSQEFIKHVKQHHLPSLDEESASATKLSGILLPDTNQQTEDFSAVTSSVVTESSLSSMQSVLKHIDGESSVEMYLVNGGNLFLPAMETQPNNVVLATDTTQGLVDFSPNSSNFDDGAQNSSSNFEDGTSHGSVCGDLTSTSVNGIDGALLNALIKIPNLQKVILPPGDGNFHLTLVIGSDKLPLDGAIDENSQQPVVENGSINTTSTEHLPNTSLPGLTAPSTGRQHYIISSSGIMSYKKD